MQPDVFTPPWLARWQAELNGSDAYRHAARHWAWPLVLVIRPNPDGGAERAAYLELDHGACQAARPAEPADYERAGYVIAGDAPVWERILARELDPVLALLQGKLRLAKGGLLSLTRHVAAARELVAAAARVSGPVSAVPPAAGPEPASPGPVAAAGSRHFATALGALDQASVPMRLYHKAKRLGVWDPRALDFDRDRADWARLSPLEREVVLHLTALFQAGEEAVTGDILPLMVVIAREGRMEESLYLTTFLFEEAKHTEFFRRFLDDVAGGGGDLGRFHGAHYRRVFHQELPAAMERLARDASPAAQVAAAVTYHMIVEGTLAETGYHAYHEMLERHDLMPGLREGIALLKRDESRHIAYGLYLLGRLLAADPALWPAVEARMQTLIDPALGVIHELFDAYEVMPFDLRLDAFLEYALRQFRSRLARLEAAQRGALDPDTLVAE